MVYENRGFAEVDIEHETMVINNTSPFHARALPYIDVPMLSVSAFCIGNASEQKPPCELQSLHSLTIKL